MDIPGRMEEIVMKIERNKRIGYIGRIFIWLPILLFCISCQTSSRGNSETTLELLEYPEPAATEEPFEEPVVVETVEVAKEVSKSAYPGPGDSAQIVFSGAELDDLKPRMIVKNADIRLLVEDTAKTINAVTRIIGEVDGYIVSSRVWYQEELESKYQYATLTIRVPVEEFELALRRIRETGKLVLDESTSGQDVTGDYIDLNSQLENLIATRNRIRTFLDRAETADEALKVNQQLTQVEAEIARIQGRMDNLFDQASYSTINVHLEPDLPAAPANPTPTPAAWSPGNTAARATQELVDIFRNIMDGIIWFSIVILPLAVVPILLIWIVIIIVRRRRKANSMVKSQR